MKFKCSKCGEEHEDWPAIAFDMPYYYHILSEKDRKEMATLDDDFCVINHGDQVDRFIRVVMFQKVKDSCQDLYYGLWVSVGEKTFNTYSEHFKLGTLEGGFFGYLCSNIPGYKDTLSIKTDVHVYKGTNRPEIVPHNDQMDIPFVKDYFEGISLDEAERRIAKVFGNYD